jgi:hypothetical protein
LLEVSDSVAGLTVRWLLEQPKAHKSQSLFQKFTHRSEVSENLQKRAIKSNGESLLNEVALHKKSSIPPTKSHPAYITAQYIDRIPPTQSVDGSYDLACLAAWKNLLGSVKKKRLKKSTLLLFLDHI